MVKKTKAVLKNDITTVIDDGGELTAAELRTILDDTVDSATFEDVRTDADIQGVVGTMVDGNTEENISVTYDSGNNKLNFSVPTPATVTPRTDAEIQGVVGGMVASNTETGITVSYDTTDNNLDFVVDVEYIQDAVGAMLSGNTETNITVTYDDVDGKINFDVPTQTSTGTGLTASQTRKLAEITERATAVFTAPANSGLIIDDNTGTAPANSATFLNPLTVSAASTDEYYFRVEGGTSRDNLVIRRLSSTGTVLGTVDVSGAGATEVGAPDASFDWYVTAQPITVAVGDVLHLQVRSTVYDRYDLSAKVHTRAANVSNVARGSWTADDVQDAVFELQDAIADCCSVTQELTIPRRVVGRIITPTTPPVFTVGQQGMLDVSHVKAANVSQEDIYKNPTDASFVGRTHGGSRFWTFGFSAPLIGRTTPLLGLWYFFRGDVPPLPDEASARALWTATGIDVTNLMAVRLGKQHDPLDFEIGIREIYYPPMGEGPPDVTGSLGRAFLVIFDNPVPPQGNRRFEMRFGSYDYPTLALPGRVKLPSTSGTRTPADVTAGPAGATVEAALQTLNSRMTSMGSGLTASQTRKLADINENVSLTFPDAAGAAVRPANSGATSPDGSGTFPAFYSNATAAAVTRRIYFEFPTVDGRDGLSLEVQDSSGMLVGTRIDVSGDAADVQTGAVTNISRYLTDSAITVPAGGSLRLRRQATAYDLYTLSGKYRIPAGGGIVTPSRSLGLTSTDVQAALEELQQHINLCCGDSLTIPEVGELRRILPVPPETPPALVRRTDWRTFFAAGANPNLDDLYEFPTSTAEDPGHTLFGPAHYWSPRHSFNPKDVIGGVWVTLGPGTPGLDQFTPFPSNITLTPNDFFVTAAVSATDPPSTITTPLIPISSVRRLAPGQAVNNISVDRRFVTSRNLWLLVFETPTAVSDLPALGLDILFGRRQSANVELGTDVRLPSPRVTRTPTTNLPGVTVEAALQDLAGSMLSDSNKRKLGDITEVASTAYATPPGANLVYTNPANTAIIPGGAFAHPYVWSGGATGNENMYFEVDAGTDISTARIQVYTSANPPVATGTPVVVSDAAKQETSNSGKDRYLTSQHIVLTTGQSVRLETEQTTSTSFTLSDKYRIPSTGVTGLINGQKGDKGDQGVQGAYTVRIYTRSTSTPAPNNVVWVPASGGTAARLTNTGSPVTWSLTVPGPGAGDLWEATATFDPASSATNITSWSPAFQAGSSGPAGDQGIQGAQGSYTVRLYRRSTSDVLRPTGLTWTASTGVLSGSGATGWSTDVPQGSGEPVWETNAVFDPSGSDTTITAWGLPFRLTGATGASGADGRNGTDGTNGDDGAQGRYIVRLYRRSTNIVLRPTLLTWTAATGSLSGTHAVDWETTIPTGDDPAWETNAVFDPSGSATTITSWSIPLRLTGPQGEKGDQGDPGPAGTGSGALDASQTRKLAGITEDTTANTFTLGSNYRSDASRTTIRDRGPANYGNVRSQLDAYQDEFDRVENPILPDERRAENFLRPEGFSFSPSTDYRISGYSMNVGGTHPYVVPTTAFTSSIPANITVPTAGVWIELSRVGSTDPLPASLEFEPTDVNVIITAGGNITPIDVRRIWRDTTVTNGVRSNRYAVVFRNMLRSIPSGGVLSVSLGRSDYARFPMSNKFRLPSESVTRTATALTSTTLEGALEELRTSSGGSLSALDTRKLAEITEANRADTFADEPLSGISVAANVGGTLTPRDISTSWPATFTGGTGASGERLFFEIDDDANLTNLFMRVLNEDGTVNMSLSVSDAVSQSNPNTGKLRYLARQTFNNPTNGTIRLQRRSAGTLGYTLSDNFIVPVSTLDGELKASDIVSAASGNLVATDVQAALNELQGDIDDQPGEAKAFFDHVELTGTLTNTTTASDFYYLPSASLPERDLTKWTHVTNSQFPQPTLTSSTPYVVLLNDDKYPNMITWAPASTQPNDPRTNASPANILASGFNQLDGLRLPEGYEGFEFIMPSWNAASTLLTGARLQIGDLARGDVRRVDLGAAVKVTDDNLDITNPNTTLTENQREKLQGLQVKTYDQAAATEGKPHADYKLMAATAWPDANVDYSTFDPITRPNLMQRPSYTGIRESRGGRSGLASFFNLVTDTPATFEQPVPNTRGYNVLYNQRYSTANEYADCAGVWGGTIKAEDTSSSSNFRVDDGRGLFATMTLHLPPELSNGSYPIMNIGNEDEDGNHALVLRKGIDDTYPPTTDLAVKRWEGPRTSTTSMQYVDETLEGPAGQTSQVYRAPFGATSINIPHVWIVPAAMAASSANPARLRMFVRVWDSGSDLGEHDFTSALPASFRSISDLTVNNPTNSAPGVVTDFTLDLFGAGFPGPLSVACNAKYIAADASEGGSRSLEIHFNSLNNPALYYEVRMEASSQQSVTIPAGRFREDVIAAGVPDGASEIGFYTYATGAAGSRKMNYRAAINGRSGDLELDDFTDANSRVPLGAVPVTFGHASSPPAIAVNRFAIFKPTGVLSVANMNELTTPSERNRADVGGLVRHAGGEYKEVFSPSYKATMFTSGAAQNLPHVHPGSSASPATTNNATPVTINWTNNDTPPELSFVSGSTSDLVANTNFTGNVTLDAGIQFDDSALQGNVNVQAKGFLLFRGQIQEKIGTGAWTKVPGPELYIEMRVQLYDNGVERPETASLGDPMLRRMFSTVVKFKAGAQYRVQATGFRLHAATSISGGRVWPAGDSVVRLAANNTFLQILVTPTL